MPNQSKMVCQLELSVCLPIYCICLSTVLHISVKISYWGLCFLLTRIATRWSFLVICWWFANLWLLKSRNLKTLLGVQAREHRGQATGRLNGLLVQGSEFAWNAKLWSHFNQSGAWDTEVINDIFEGASLKGAIPSSPPWKRESECCPSHT